MKRSKLTDYFSSEKIKPNCDLKTDDSNAGTSELTSSLPAKRRKFQTTWLQDLPWINYNEADGTAKCSVCAEYPGTSDPSSKVVRGFVGPFKLETFKKHGNSRQHLLCVNAQKAHRAPENTPFAKCIKKINAKMFNHLKVVFNAAYYIAKKNRPFSDMKDVLTLLNNCGVDVLEEYDNNNSCKEITHQISDTIKKELIIELKGSEFISFLLDGSTDKSDEEHVIFYARYLKDNSIKEAFLGMMPLENGTSEGYLDAMKKIIEQTNLDILGKSVSVPSLVGMGTDGAPVMIGKENGLVNKVKSIVGMEHLISIHCVAHRLNLAVLSSIKGTKYLQKIDTTLKKLYKFYQQSPKRLRELKKVAEILETEILKFQYLHNVRWVASKVTALTALVQNYPSVVMHLEEIANGSGDDAAVAKGLLKELKSYRFLRFAHFLLDFLKVFNILSQVFQKSSQLLCLINSHVSKALFNLENLKTVCGDMESRFVSNTNINGQFKEMELTCIDSTAFEGDKKNILESGIKFLKERFPENLKSIADATKIFDTFQWPTGTNLISYGESEIKTLGLNFLKFLKSKDMTEDDYLDKLLSEWFDFKTHGKGFNFELLIEKVNSMKDRFPHLCKLVNIVAVLPVSTASCERGFSLMNLIKNKLRNRMEVHTLESLMMINFNGPELKDFIPDKAIDQWYFNSKTVRHVNGHTHKQR